MTMPQVGRPFDFDTLAQDMTGTGWHFHRASAGPFDRFQVMGERGCGTNVIRKSIQRTLQIDYHDALGWKHGFPAAVGIPPSFLVVCAVRAPRPWAVSLYKRPWHATAEIQSLPFETFIRSPWHSYIDRMGHFSQVHPALNPVLQPLQWDRDPVTGEVFKNIFALRNAKHRGLLSYPARGASVVYVQLEAFNRDPVTFLEAMQDAFALDQTPRGYRPITRRMGNRWTPEVDRAPTPNNWAQNDVQFMSDHLDSQIEGWVGYSRP